MSKQGIIDANFTRSTDYVGIDIEDAINQLNTIQSSFYDEITTNFANAQSVSNCMKN